MGARGRHITLGDDNSVRGVAAPRPAGGNRLDGIGVREWEEAACHTQPQAHGATPSQPAAGTPRVDRRESVEVEWSSEEATTESSSCSMMRRTRSSEMPGAATHAAEMDAGAVERWIRMIGGEWILKKK